MGEQCEMFGRFYYAISLVKTKIFTKMMTVLVVVSIGYFWSAPSLGDAFQSVNGLKPFGIVFQVPEKSVGYKEAASDFGFSWNLRNRIGSMIKYNKNGNYFCFHNLTMTAPHLSNKILPDYDYLVKKHKDWFIKTENGEPAESNFDSRYLHLDLGNHDYVDWIIGWLKCNGFDGKQFIGHIGIDYGVFFAHKTWSTYDNHETYRMAWEYFLRRLSDEFRPRYKVLLNVGSGDISTFARMIQWTDGVLQENICRPLHDSRFDSKEARKSIKNQWQRGQWCKDNGKIYAVRYFGTINAISLNPAAGAPVRYLSVGDRKILIRDTDRVIGTIHLSHERANSLEKLANCLRQYHIDAKVINPYSESSTLNKLKPLSHVRIADNTMLKMKKAPHEAFQFGYAAFLMVAGHDSYFVMGDERWRTYNYPEMELDLGCPKGRVREVRAQVYKRDFQFYTAYLNLSDTHYYLQDKDCKIGPMRGVLVRCN